MSFRIGKKIQFYGLAGLLNLAVGVMFYTINITPAPVLAITPQVIKPVISRQVPATQGIPNRITIPSLAIDLPVGIGSFNPEDGSWTVDTTQAYYADVSMPINNSNGATLIYGHAQSSVFETLPTIQPGAEATVYTDSGFIFLYRMVSMREVQPNDVSVFTDSGPPTLVLQTCVGAYSELRALFSFRLESVNRL